MKKSIRIAVVVCMAIATIFSVILYSEYSAHAATATANKVIVPAYFYPDVWDSPNNWYTMCDAMPAQSIAIMNPSSGPGTSQISDYTTAVTHCQNENQNVIGYVHTSYGTRSETDVKAEIDQYYTWYGVDGIFLDEMSSDASTQSYYSDLYAYIHAKGDSGHNLVVGNMGTYSTTDWPLSTGNVVDILVSFEGSYSDYQSIQAPAWTKNYASTDFAALVYGTDSSEVISTCSSLNTQGPGISYRYITDDTLPNPWDTLASYWPTQC